MLVNKDGLKNKIAFTFVTFAAFLSGRNFPIAVDYDSYLIYQYCYFEDTAFPYNKSKSVIF
jgi:hypothetical protein